MSDAMVFQKGDLVETNEDCMFEPTLWWLVRDTPPYEGADPYLKARLKGTVLSSDEVTTSVLMQDGQTESLMTDWLDLVHRPINDPAKYDRALL